MSTALTTTKPRPRDWWALAVLVLPVLLISVESTALNFALPAISRELDPSGTQLLWMVDVYALVLAGLLVSMGTLGDRIGRRKLLLIGAVGFGVVAAATAFAPSAEWVIAGRAMMGVFGATLMPATLSLLRNIFVDPNARRFAIACWAAGFGGGAALGPIVGGILLEHFSWGSVFLLAVPVLVPLLILTPFLVPESRDPNPGRIDAPSIALSMLTMLPIVYGIKEAAAGGQLLLGGASLAIGLLFGWAFVHRQNTIPNPMLDVSLFAGRGFSAGVAVNVIGNIALVGFIFILTQYLQVVQGLSPMISGVMMIPALVLNMSAGFVAVALVRRFRARTVIAVGMSLTALGYLLSGIIDPQATILGVIVGLCFIGVGIGMAETLSNDLILSSAPANRAGAASAISETGYEVGTVLGTSLIGGAMTGFYQSHLNLPAGLTIAQGAQVHNTVGGASEVADQVTGRNPGLARDVMVAADGAFVSGMQLLGILSAVGVGVAAILIFRALRHVESRPEIVEAPAGRTAGDDAEADQRPLSAASTADN